MKTIAAYLGLRAGPNSIPFSKAPKKLQLLFIVVASAVFAVMGKLLGL